MSRTVAGRDAACASLTLGWQVARMFSAALDPSVAIDAGEDLPGLAELPPATLMGLSLDEVEASIGVLSGLLGDAGLAPVDTAGLRRLVAGGPGDGETTREAIAGLHVEVMTRLAGGAPSCAKAYGLGQALADTCVASQSRAQVDRHLGRPRSVQIRACIEDLKSLLPEHAGQAVSNSLGSWIDWADQHPPASMADQDVERTAAALHAQGERWRALLSGEKDAEDALELDDHANIVRRALMHTSRVGVGLAATLWLPLAVSAGLLGLGLALAVASLGAARVIAGLGLVAIAIALAWRSVVVVLARVGMRLEEPIWGAECDLVIGERITQLPILTQGRSSRGVVARSAAHVRLTDRMASPAAPAPSPARPAAPEAPRPAAPVPMTPRPGPPAVPAPGGSVYDDDDETVTLDLSGHHVGEGASQRPDPTPTAPSGEI